MFKIQTAHCYNCWKYQSITIVLDSFVGGIEHASSTDEVEFVIVRIWQITLHLQGLEGVEYLTEQVHNSLVRPSTPAVKMQ